MERSRAWEIVREAAEWVYQNFSWPEYREALSVLDAPDPRDALLKEAREHLRFLDGFVPEWATKSERGLDPTMYGTGTFEGDAIVITQVADAREFLKKLDGDA